MIRETGGGGESLCLDLSKRFAIYNATQNLIYAEQMHFKKESYPTSKRKKDAAEFFLWHFHSPSTKACMCMHAMYVHIEIVYNRNNP